MAKSQKSASKPQTASVKPVKQAVKTESTKPIKQSESTKPTKQSESTKPVKQSAKPAAKQAEKPAAKQTVEAPKAVASTHLDSKQLTQGLHALYTLIARSEDSKSKSTLIDKDPFIYLQFTLKRIPAKETNVPIRVTLNHTLYGADTECCVITKDEHDDVDAYMAAHPIPNVKFLSLKQINAQYGRHAEKRELLALYDLFLADERVLPLLPRLLGKSFFEKKKQPAPVKLRATYKDREIKKAMHSTYMFISTGPVLQVRIARCSFSRQQTADNISYSVEKIVQRIPGKWANVQSIQVRTHDSMAIPLYTSLPLQAVEGDEEDEDEGVEFDAEIESEEEPEPVKPAQGKGKKRAAQEITPEVVEPIHKQKPAKKQAKQPAPAPAPAVEAPVAAPVAAPQSSKKRKQTAEPVEEPAAAPQSNKKGKATPAPAPAAAQPEATPSKKQQKVRPSTSEQPQSAKKQKTATIEEPTPKMKAPATPSAKRAPPASHQDTPHPVKSQSIKPKSGKKARASVAAQ